jgi:hypothetical protein
MADIPLAAYIIGTVSPVVAGALPLFVGWLRETGRDKRERAERLEQERAGQCVDLLTRARNYRVLQENAEDSSGDELIAYCKEIRQAAADITGQADKVEIMVPLTGDTASMLAAEARTLAAAMTNKANRARNETLIPPDFTRFDRRLDEFKAATQLALGHRLAMTGGTGMGVEPSPVPGQLSG